MQNDLSNLIQFSFAQTFNMNIDPAIAGLIAGAIYHCVVQYPNQARLFTSLYSFVLTNTVFVILLLRPKNAIQLLGIGKIIQDWMMFDLVYVTTPFMNILNLSVFLQLS